MIPKRIHLTTNTYLYINGEGADIFSDILRLNSVLLQALQRWLYPWLPEVLFSVFWFMTWIGRMDDDYDIGEKSQ